MSNIDRTRDEILDEASPRPRFDKEGMTDALLTLQLEVLLDIRDALYRIENKEGVPKWGPKI